MRHHGSVILCALRVSAFCIAIAAGSVSSASAAEIQYTFSFPEPEHHWMQVEATFTGLGDTPLELRISRSSPGRYAVHDFAKNVYDVRAFSSDNTPLAITRPDQSGWTVASHGGSVRVAYKVFGDRVDGTYLAIDTTHAHLNMPASVMWARGLEDTPVAITFTQPAGQAWQVATQLHATPSPLQFTAPNLQYLMDSPVEFGPIAIRQFSVAERTFRVAFHSPNGGLLDSLTRDIERIVRVEGAIFGEYPAYEPGHYTFLIDYLPYANSDAMEHRNSTVMSSTGPADAVHIELLEKAAHEFFHTWNVERIRPRSLEPFDFERANMAGELWLAEGFTQYYGFLALGRAGIDDIRTTAASLEGLITPIVSNAATAVRSAEEMSLMATFTDGGRPTDRTNWSNTIISYYSFGGAIALALDLTLRERSGQKVTLDDYMRAMWRLHGKPGGSREGYVDHPYTMSDAEARLAEVSGDRAFARDFFGRYIQGHDVPDYARLLSQAGLVVRKRNPGRAWWGAVRFEFGSGGVRLATAPAFDSPLYLAGLDLGDELREVDGGRVGSPDDLSSVLRRHEPGENVTVTYTDRSGAAKSSAILLTEDPTIEVVLAESIGGQLTPAQSAFRERWLGGKQQ
jgi:predicted metalloprotease with PDZ domain